MSNLKFINILNSDYFIERKYTCASWYLYTVDTAHLRCNFENQYNISIYIDNLLMNHANQLPALKI